jgi:hypothetical protein
MQAGHARFGGDAEMVEQASDERRQMAAQFGESRTAQYVHRRDAAEVVNRILPGRVVSSLHDGLPKIAKCSRFLRSTGAIGQKSERPEGAGTGNTTTGIVRRHDGNRLHGRG